MTGHRTHGLVGRRITDVEMHSTLRPLHNNQDDRIMVGRTERWLLPAVALIGGVLAFGVAALALRRLYRNLPASDSARSAGRSVIPLGTAATIAVLVAWQTAGAAFNRIFGSFDKHDAAAPLLIAAPVGFTVLLLVLPAVFAAST